MAHPCKHVDRFEISQVSLNDSVAVVQQIEAPGGFPVFRTMTPRRVRSARSAAPTIGGGAVRLAGCEYYSKKSARRICREIRQS